MWGFMKRESIYDYMHSSLFFKIVRKLNDYSFYSYNTKFMKQIYVLYKMD